MGAHEQQSSYPAQRRYQEKGWRGCTSPTSINGSGSQARSSPTATPASRQNSQKPFANNCKSNKTSLLPSTHKQTGYWNEKTNGSNNTSDSWPTRGKTTGAHGSR